MGWKNWGLANQTTNKVGLNDKRMKINKCKLKKIVLDKVWGDCSYILLLDLITSLVPDCYSVSPFFFLSLSPISSSFFYTLLFFHLCSPRACQMVDVDTCPISTFHKSSCSSCNGDNHCSCITSILIGPES